ncbi:MAG TPA: hypothetical protein VFQ26_10250 [Nitrospiraceae bacterium]|nr:hypothetical protein [Nitrospiraceae bacterium]
MNRIDQDKGKPDPLTPLNKHVKCPYCGAQLVASQGIAHAKGKTPKIGDAAICTDCGEASFVTEDMELVKPNENQLKELLADPTYLMSKALVKAASKPNQDAYERKIMAMSHEVKAWVVAHPEASPSIQYNFTKDVFTIGVMQDAVAKKYVSLNDDGRKMLEELGWLGAESTAPTVMMVKIAMEVAFKEGE